MNANPKRRVAIVGTNIGSTLHVRALQGAGFEVTGFVGRDRERTRCRAAHFGVGAAWDSIDAALDSDIDAVVIASPPATHHPFTMKALAAGKHVLCEKPLALDAGEAREMAAAAQESRLITQLVHPHRWFPRHALPRKLARDGAIGEVLQIHGHFDAPLIGNDLGGIPDWWLRSETGGGWLRNYASHGIDTARYILGEIISVSGSVRSDPGIGMSADSGYAFHFETAGGAIGTMAGTCRTRDFSTQTRLIGSSGVLEYDWQTLWLADGTGRREIEADAELLMHLRAGSGEIGTPQTALPHPESPYQAIHTSDAAYAQQVAFARSFLNRINDASWHHEAVATFDDGLAHMLVIEAVEQSAQRRQWVDVPVLRTTHP